jgi:CRISPR-associated protein Cas5h
MDPSDIPQCLSFTVRGHWGHFRRPEGNSIKNTFRVIPRMTAAGLMGAILGRGRNTYYEAFREGASAMAIEPHVSRTLNMPMLSLSTATEQKKSLSQHRKTLSMSEIESDTHRQRHNYEVLVEPEYRIHFWTADEAFYDDLREKLVAGESHYTPSLGLSEHLATVDYHGEFDVKPAEPGEVDSAVPGGIGAVRPDTDVRVQTERSQGYMEADNPAGGGFSHRRTTGFIDWAYTTDDGPLVTTGDVSVARLPTLRSPHTGIDGARVVFV